MPIKTTYSQLRKNLARYLDEASENREIVLIKRKKKGAAALIAADELSSLVETAFLLQSPKNAERLLSALGKALKNDGDAFFTADLRHKLGFDAENT